MPCTRLLIDLAYEGASRTALWSKSIRSFTTAAWASLDWLAPSVKHVAIG